LKTRQSWRVFALLNTFCLLLYNTYERKCSKIEGKYFMSNVIELVNHAPSQRNLNLGVVKGRTKHLTIIKIRDKVYAFKKEEVESTWQSLKF
jgi:hypothetical protein